MDETKKEVIENKESATVVQDDAPQEQKTDGPQYRYQCEACSNIAFYANTKSDMAGQCQNCGMQIRGIFDDRFIPLTQEEKDSLKAQKN